MNYQFALIIDDDPIIQSALTNFLVTRGFSTFSAHTVSEAESICMQNTIALAFVDLQLGQEELDGYEAIRSIRTLQGANTHIVTISSANAIHEITHALECGANDYLIKPLSKEILETHLHTFENIRFHSEEKESTPHSHIRKPITLSFDISIRKVSFTGMTFESSHLPYKESVLRIPATFFTPSESSDNFIEMTIIENWLLTSEPARFGVRARFLNIESVKPIIERFIQSHVSKT